MKVHPDNDLSFTSDGLLGARVLRNSVSGLSLGKLQAFAHHPDCHCSLLSEVTTFASPVLPLSMHTPLSISYSFITMVLEMAVGYTVCVCLHK